MKIENLHLHANDLHALSKIAESDPELANKIVDQRDNEDRRYNTSYRFGVGASAVLVSVVVLSFTMTLINLGVWATLGLVRLALAIALLVRVILTGEWSETTWFGKFVGVTAKALGSKEKSNFGNNE